MAALGTSNLTFLDLAKRLDPNNNIATIAEVLAQRNELMPYMVWKEGMLVDGEQGTIRTGIPEPTFRKYNAGVQPTKSTTAVVKANCAKMEDFTEVDSALARLSGNVQAFRFSEDKAKIQGFNNKFSRYLFFGNEGSEPEAFTGFAPHFNSLSAANAENIISGGAAGGQTDLNSIWLIVFSDDSVYGIVPRGSQAGLQTNDLGEETKENAGGVTGALMRVFRTQYIWDAGLFIKDWRQVVRIPNIDKSTLLPDASSGANLPDLMYQALEQVDDLSGGTPVFCMSRAMRSMVRRQLTNATKNSTLTIENVGGKMIERFQGVPMLRVDALAADEAAVA